MIEEFSVPIVLWTVIITLNLLTYINGRESDFNSEKELGISPHELIKQISLKSRKPFTIDIEASEHQKDLVVGKDFVVMSPQFAYSAERQDIVAIAEKVHPLLDRNITPLNLLIAILRFTKLLIAFTSGYLFISASETFSSGWLGGGAIALLVLSSCEGLLHAARLIRIKNSFYRIHEFYPYSSVSLMSVSLMRGFNQFWWLRRIIRFIGIAV